MPFLATCRGLLGSSRVFWFSAKGILEYDQGLDFDLHILFRYGSVSLRSTISSRAFCLSQRVISMRLFMMSPLRKAFFPLS